MLIQNSYEYIKIGLAVRLLRNISKENNKQFTIEIFEDLKSQLTAAEFNVSLAFMQSVTYHTIASQLSEGEQITAIGENTRTQISEFSISLENVIFAEALTKNIYILPNRRYNTDFLLNNPQKIFKAGTFEKLDDIAKSDISSSCRCILFGEATAAAFHILRATESVLKNYYLLHRKQKRLQNPMWANMVEQLKAKTTNKPPPTLLASLDLIRKAYRNPTQHPEALYLIDSAQDLFGVCVDAIGKMGEEFS